MLIDQTGRYVTVGIAYVGLTQPNFTLGLMTRHLPDGMLDETFEDDGVIHLGWQDSGLFLQFVREQTDGKLVVGGFLQKYDGNNTSSAEAVVCRLEADGAIDTSFGTEGCRTLDTVGGRPGLRSWFADMELLPDGRILVLGEPVIDAPEDPRAFALVRLLPDGGDDLDFGDASICPDPAPRCGIAFSPADLEDAVDPAALALDPQEGRIVLAGSINQQFFRAFVTLRFTAAGDGVAAFEPLYFSGLMGGASAHYVSGVQVLPDSAVLVSGHVNRSGEHRVAIGKLKPDGQHDSGFGIDGHVLHDFDAQQARNAASGSFLQSDGKLLVAGWSQPVRHCHVLRIDSASGSLDTAFGDGGVVSLDSVNALSTECYAEAVVADSRRVLVAGSMDLAPDGIDDNPFLFRLDRDDLFRAGFGD